MLNFTTRKIFFLPSFELDAKESKKLDDFLLILEKSNVSSIFPKEDKNDVLKGGRPHYSYYNLLATVLYGFAFDQSTLRDLEEACNFDLRYIYLMEQERPSHTIFADFINSIIVPNREYIFSAVTKAIIEACSVDVSDSFIDGSKFEADANKYKFVWKPTKFHIRLCDKVRALLGELKLNHGIPAEGIIQTSLIANKLNELTLLNELDDKYQKQLSQLNDYLIKALEYDEKERICGPNRNSYYKTDHDATAMTLKEDYYSGLGSNMHAGYNTQLMVSKGIICAYYVSQSRNDINDFIPVINKYYEYYNAYPVNICADAGYGSLDNYRYLDEHNIGNYVKNSSFEGNVSGKRPDCYRINDNGTITCLNGKSGMKVKLEHRHPKNAGAVFYRVEGCNECPFKIYCKRFMNNKEEDFRIFEVIEQLAFYKKKAEDNLLSPKGIEMRVNRSSQVEGSFGVIKQDMNYTRLRRTTMEKVETEFMLVFLGYNIRKLFRYLDGKAKFNYWKAPDNLKAEAKKKPSAKRLSTRYSKDRAKSVNETAKTYTYKKGL